MVGGKRNSQENQDGQGGFCVLVILLPDSQQSLRVTSGAWGLYRVDLTYDEKLLGAVLRAMQSKEAQNG